MNIYTQHIGQVAYIWEEYISGTRTEEYNRHWKKMPALFISKIYQGLTQKNL